MTKITWWLLLVGGLYVLLALTSLRVLFVDPQMFGAMNPFAAIALALKAFADAWLIFVLEIGVLGVIMMLGGISARQLVRGIAKKSDDVKLIESLTHIAGRLDRAMVIPGGNFVVIFGVILAVMLK